MPVIPAEAGIQRLKHAAKQTKRTAWSEFRGTATFKLLSPLRGDLFINWIPASAGMTEFEFIEVPFNGLCGMKRAFDLVVALLVLTLAWPLIAVLALLVRINLGAPVLFRQQRPGLNAKPFYVYKFRTMLQACDGDGKPLPDEERMTRFGSFLRRFSLDELPQLFNVLKGDLSLVGPRPLLMEYLPLYNAEQARRHLVKPGITGWAQVNGRNAISWEDKFKYDVWYVDHRSFWLDLKILWQTVKKVVRSEGVSQTGNVTMEKFRGTAISRKNIE